MKRYDQLTDELLDNPVLPLLFITKFVELAALHAVGAAPLEAVAIMGALAGPVTAFWYFFGERVEEAIDNTVEDAIED